MHSLRKRLNARDESAFTLIELLVVLIIIGVLLAIAIPSYLGFQKKAQSTAAASDVRSAIPDAEAYYSDKNSYASMDTTALLTYDNGMKVGSLTAPTKDGIITAGPRDVAPGTNNGYCISAVVGGHWAYVKGPGGDVTQDDTVTTNPCA